MSLRKDITELQKAVFRYRWSHLGDYKSGDRIEDLQKDVTRLSDRVNTLWIRYTELMNYLGIDRITYAEKTIIEKVKK
jgi:hypothetical protein